MSVKEIVEDAAKSNGSKVNEVNIVVGSFSSVVADALEFAMEVAKKDRFLKMLISVQRRLW